MMCRHETVTSGIGIARAQNGREEILQVIYTMQRKKEGMFIHSSDLHSLMVLSFSRAPEAIMFSVG